MLRLVWFATLSASFLGGVACGVGGAPTPPAWVRLARDLETAPRLSRPAVREFGLANGRVVRVSLDGDHAWLETTLERSDWTFRPDVQSGSWLAPNSLQGTRRPANEPAQRLSGGGHAFAHSPPDLTRRRWTFGPGSFVARGEAVYLKLEEGREPPARVDLAVFAGRGGLAGGVWRMAGDRFSGDGFSLWSGESAEFDIDPLELPPGSRLRFATCVEPALPGRNPGPRTVSFRVWLDDALLFHHEMDPTAAAFTWHEVALPRAGPAPAVIRLEVSGALAYSSFLAPTIGPAARGPRSAKRARPNIVLFLADTFRADNMRAYGSEFALTPYLDRIAEGSLLFRRAWSVGTRTLPAHASLFTGRYPLEAGVVSETRALPAELVTAAELLAGHGYRTGAITDSVIVSQRFGFDRGFEWFDEYDGGLASTLERVGSFLAADDGRPLFLFVHTYRTHAPYTVSEATRRELGDILGIEEEFPELQAMLSQLRENSPPPPAGSPRIGRRQIARRLRALYLGAAHDLDQSFQSLHQDLSERGLLDDGYLIFTSDHGEAFLEHGVLYHTGKVWEEQSRIPLFIAGSGVQSQIVQHAASLVDLPRTLAEMAGMTPDETWRGRSLLSLDSDRPTYVFESKGSERSTLALIQGDHKVISVEDAGRLRSGALLGAFDLTADPGERANLADSRMHWPRRLARRLGPIAAELLEPAAPPRPAELDPGKVDQLRALGYLRESPEEDEHGIGTP